MATVGSVFLAGRAAGSAWVEYAPAAGTLHAGFSEQGSASAFAGGLAVLLTPRSNAGSQSIELEVARRGVEQIAEGRYHGAGVAGDGTVYAWGVNELGQLGQGVGPKTLAASATPMQVRSLRDIVSVACGDSHTVAVRYDGAVYSWGSSSSGQLGHGSTHPTTPAAPEFVPAPRCMSSLHRLRITSAAAGSQFTLLVAATGELFSCGEGASGQLGLGRVTKVDVPTRVALVGGPPSRALLESIRARGALVGEAGEEEAIDTNVAAVAAGWGHSLILTRSGHVLTCGLNTHSQLGLGDSSTRHEATLVYELASSKDDDGGEVLMPRPLRAARVAAGRFHSACLTPTGRALTWGSSVDGRLGHSFGEGPANLYAASVGAMAGGEPDSAASLGVDFAQPKASVPGITSEPSTEALDIDGLLTTSMELGEYPVASRNDATPATSGMSTWPFKGGVGPLRAPPAGQEAAGYRVPAHVLNNAAAGPVRHAPAARDPTTGRAHYPDVEAGTWSFPAVRTPSHVRGLEEGRVYAAGEADRIARQPFEPLRDAFNASVGSLEAMVAATRKPGAAAVPLGKPWLRAPLRRSDDAPCNVPTQVTHPALAGRPVVNITCGEGETLFFVPAVLSSVTPPQVLTAGGSVLTLSGPGLSSLCKVPEAALRATLATAASAEAAAAAIAAYTPVPDESGLVPIPGVFVRFTCSFEDLLSGTAEPEGGVRSEVRVCKAYYPRLYDFGGFSAGGGGGTALAFREDGTLGAVGGVSTAGPTDMDVMLTISPSVTRPCVATVQVIVPSPGEAEDAAFTAEGANVVHGAQRLECISEPYLTGCTPSSIAVGAGPGPVVSIAGEWLFGTALVDSVARPVAEDLTRTVTEALRAREAAEEAGIARELAAIAGQQVDAPPASEPAAGGLLDFTLTAGSQETPCDILVCFDIIVNGSPAGRTDPVRAWYTLKYEEKKLDVVAARAALIAGMQGKGGSRGASRGGSPGSRSGVVPPSTTPWLVTDAAEEDGASPSRSKVEEEEPTIVGVYAATILVELPEVGGLVAGKAGTPVPAAVSAVLTALASAELDGAPVQHVDEAALAAAQAYSHGDAVVAAAAAAAGASPAVQLKPRISFNAGYDWSSGNASVQAMRPATSFSTPALAHLGRTTEGVIYGTGLPVGATALVRVSPLGGGESISVKGRFIDGNRVGYTLPSLFPLVGGPEAVGFASFLLTLLLDGMEVAGPPGGMLLTAYAGAGRQGSSALVALGGTVSLTLAPCTIPRVDALAVRSAGRGHEGDVLPGLSWIPPTARIGCVHTGAADKLRVAVQSAGGKPVDAAFTCDASAGTLEVTLPEGTPAGPFSVLIAADGVMASAVVMAGAGCAFDPASLSITGLGPKKLAPGAELLLTMGGLGAVTALAEGGTPAAPTVRLTVAGALGPVYTGVVPATLLPEAAGVTTTLPGVDVAPALAGADAEAAVSFDGGKSWTPPFPIKLAKK